MPSTGVTERMYSYLSCALRVHPPDPNTQGLPIRSTVTSPVLARLPPSIVSVQPRSKSAAKPKVPCLSVIFIFSPQNYNVCGPQYHGPPFQHENDKRQKALAARKIKPRLFKCCAARTLSPRCARRILRRARKPLLQRLAVFIWDFGKHHIWYCKAVTCGQFRQIVI